MNSSGRLLLALPEKRTAGRTYRLPTEAEWSTPAKPAAGPGIHVVVTDEDTLVDHGWFTTCSRRHIPSAKKNRMPGACLTCTATCGGVGADWYGENYYGDALGGLSTMMVLPCAPGGSWYDLAGIAGRRSRSGSSRSEPAAPWASAWSQWPRSPPWLRQTIQSQRHPRPDHRSPPPPSGSGDWQSLFDGRRSTGGVRQAPENGRWKTSHCRRKAGSEQGRGTADSGQRLQRLRTAIEV